MPSRKLSQIRAMVLVIALELERLELAQHQKKKVKKPPHVELKLIKGGKG